ncbi:hypothetical protein [Streptomyces sp. TR02-1]|uniref:hypothetical protein n=1 Tax=Streptomyces sp. TR02-1 TaxID=3385977 RepID=UPI0039A2BF10
MSETPDLAAIFGKAAQSTSWLTTNLGVRTDVSHHGSAYTVLLPKEGEGAAYISGCEHIGGTDLAEWEATLTQTIPIVGAARSALRIL